ncbi:helix-turn-helix domain-containing protein [Flammeovirga kamogawensis]|uniref:Helix-turn-helix transcriptional regulator n=1 Tax=Flammeovirga kamogawensis TaxID=373891 RepID=A0ABX8GQB2_9BACT|nr:helix-turn-helix transcriptional regulator [Flammeovirga kamogawensis]MBB6463465.1 AraC-like DNA-binding protein [Flammeovirga kamogawensis]QWG05609.1 helix-turn-helix transcriptional regulator [Flammeovirga kamogawensis]TRX67441.1 helix-turn-helix transcriptional regulator [Flammeovirga kamogawensis]
MSKHIKLNNNPVTNQLVKLQEALGGELITENHLVIDNDILVGDIHYYSNGYTDFTIVEVEVKEDLKIEFFHIDDFHYTAQFFGENLIYTNKKNEDIKVSIPNGFFILKDAESIYMHFKKGEKVKQVTIYFTKEILRDETNTFLEKLASFVFHEGDTNLRLWKRTAFNSKPLDEDLREEWYLLKMMELNLIFQNVIRTLGTKGEKRIYSDYEIDIAFLIKKVIIEDVKNKPVVSELALEYGINLNKLEKIFRHVFNETIYQFYKTVRINKVKEEIYTTDKAFTEIAYDYGYTDVNHMSKNFKANFGVTPTQFKESK